MNCCLTRVDHWITHWQLPVVRHLDKKHIQSWSTFFRQNSHWKGEFWVELSNENLPVFPHRVVIRQRLYIIREQETLHTAILLCHSHPSGRLVQGFRVCGAVWFMRTRDAATSSASSWRAATSPACCRKSASSRVAPTSTTRLWWRR